MEERRRRGRRRRRRRREEEERRSDRTTLTLTTIDAAGSELRSRNVKEQQKDTAAEQNENKTKTKTNTQTQSQTKRKHARQTQRKGSRRRMADDAPSATLKEEAQDVQEVAVSQADGNVVREVRPNHIVGGYSAYGDWTDVDAPLWVCEGLRLLRRYANRQFSAWQHERCSLSETGGQWNERKVQC